MKKKIIDLVVGTRPNFMKAAAVWHAFKNTGDWQNVYDFRLIHTGQHFSENMSDLFFDNLGLPDPHINFGIGGGSHSEQVAKIMVAYEAFLMTNRPDLVVVIGDVNSTLAACFAAKKLNIKVAHIEGGLRSFDRSMPEELNRLATDSVSDYFFTTSEYANRNLLAENVDPQKIFFVGNTMIDSLIRILSKLKAPASCDELNSEEFVLCTLHRPSNVNVSIELRKILRLISRSVKSGNIILPVHPRLEGKIEDCAQGLDNIKLIKALPYPEFVYLLKNCVSVITDSGGVSEEATYLRKRCFTLRNSTERPETIENGSNILVRNIEELPRLLASSNSESNTRYQTPERWDGRAGNRILENLSKILC